MSDSERIARNTAFLTVGEITTRVLSFLLVVAIARYLGDVGLGAYGFVFALTDLLLNFIDLGVPMYLAREMAKNKAATRTYLSNALGLRVLIIPLIPVIGLATWLIAVFTIHAAAPETMLITALAIAGMAFSFLNDPLRIAFMAHERDEYYSGLIIVERLMFTGAGFALLLNGYGLVPILTAFLISQAISLLTTAYFVRKKLTSFTIKLDTAAIASIIKNSAWFGITNFLRMVYQRTDIIMLGIMQGFAAAGWYTAAYRITESLRFIPLVVVPAIFPALSRFHTQSKETGRALYEKAFYYMIIAALPLAAGLTLTADRIIPFVYHNPGFYNSVLALKLLIWAEALLFLHYIMGFLLNAIGKQHLFTIVTATYAAANVALNLILIPKHSYVGAGVAAIITQAIAVVTLYYLSAKNGYGLNVPKLAYKPAIAAAAMAAALVALKGAHLLISIPVAAAIYVAALAITKGIGKEEVQLIKQVMQRKEAA